LDFLYLISHTANHSASQDPLSPKKPLISTKLRTTMLTSANSILSTSGYAIEETQTGVPSSKELLESGFTWQCATDHTSPLFNKDAEWLDLAKKTECTVYAIANNAEVVGLVYTAIQSLTLQASTVCMVAPWIIHNADRRNNPQLKVNRFLGRVAMLSRAATELSLMYSPDSQLSILNNELRSSYRVYHQQLYCGDSPIINLRTNVDDLVSKITALATILAEIPVAANQTSESLFPDKSGEASSAALSVEAPSSGQASGSRRKGGLRTLFGSQKPKSKKGKSE
jgi:hypothetical protein